MSYPVPPEDKIGKLSAGHRLAFIGAVRLVPEGPAGPVGPANWGPIDYQILNAISVLESFEMSHAYLDHESKDEHQTYFAELLEDGPAPDGSLLARCVAIGR